MQAMLIVAAIVSTMFVGGSAPMWVGRFENSGKPPAPWRPVKLSSERPTTYRVAYVAGKPAIEAIAPMSNPNMKLFAMPMMMSRISRLCRTRSWK